MKHPLLTIILLISTFLFQEHLHSQEKEVNCINCNSTGQIFSGEYENCSQCYGNGKVVSHTTQSSSTCDVCGGDGLCNECAGRGTLPCYEHDSNGNGYCTICKNTGVIYCFRCGGSGTCGTCKGVGTWVNNKNHYKTCPKCSGKGKFKVTEKCVICNGKGGFYGDRESTFNVNKRKKGREEIDYLVGIIKEAFQPHTTWLRLNLFDLSGEYEIEMRLSIPFNSRRSSYMKEYPESYFLNESISYMLNPEFASTEKGKKIIEQYNYDYSTSVSHFFKFRIGEIKNFKVYTIDYSDTKLPIYECYNKNYSHSPYYLIFPPENLEDVQLLDKVLKQWALIKQNENSLY